MADEDHNTRVARNEARFRDVNEGIGAGRDPSDGTTLIGFVCECGHRDCRRLIELTPAEYDAVRSNPLHFAVLPGHEILEAEHVVGQSERYTVVEKDPDAAPVVRATDPRAGSR
jgi:hypothetical protein